MEWLVSHPEVAVIIAIGSPTVKRKLAKKIEALVPNVHFETLIHPTAHVTPRVKLGKGTVVSAGSILTTDITVGDHVAINLDCTVGHDAVLHDYVTVNPSVNISGNATIGEGTDLGTSSAVIQGVSVGEWSIIGAGTVVNKDVPANVTAVGVPAKVIKERPERWYEV